MKAGDSPAEAKVRLRAVIKNRLRRLAPANFGDAGAVIAARIVDLPVWRSAGTVCAFLSMAGEIDTEEVCKAALTAGKALCLPRTDRGDLSFRVCADLKGPWDVGPFGIREPVVSAPLVDFAGLPGSVLVVVPGLAFDLEGGRLGRGKGYYDRFLRSLKEARRDVCTVGIALDCQLVDSVPVSDDDVSLDLILTG